MKTDYKIGDRLDVDIQKIVPKGLGLAFAEKLTVFVPLSAAGDKARVRISQLKSKIAFAEIEEILEPSPDRIDPPCQYFGRCGGCDFQQMDYEAQLAAKLGIIQDSLHRIGKINYDKEIPMIASPNEFEYRSRAQWHLDTRQKRIGYFRRSSHDVIDIEHCPILTPELDAALQSLRTTLDWGTFWSDRASIEAAHGSEGSISLFSPEIMEPTEDISFSVGGEKYFYSALSFFQGNQFLIEKLIETALNGAGGETALDLYCGVGLFTLPLARKFGQVIGVEGNDRAIDFAEKNAANAQLDNVRFVRDSVDDFLSGHNLENTDFVLLDPPRAGTEKWTIQNIIKLKPKQISYVSCEPSMLARDLRTLLDNGYKIESLTAFDLFPQTHHVETVARLKSM
ncbi:MAG: class I SAM-dependent RNA methyltransferase [Saprospiraceae bacterium]|nr:class I SAM-dependent RNA methyltransferase [Pyrinomonadaceae bacterium]